MLQGRCKCSLGSGDTGHCFRPSRGAVLVKMSTKFHGNFIIFVEGAYKSISVSSTVNESVVGVFSAYCENYRVFLSTPLQLCCVLCVLTAVCVCWPSQGTGRCGCCPAWPACCCPAPAWSCSGSAPAWRGAASPDPDNSIVSKYFLTIYAKYFLVFADLAPEVEGVGVAAGAEDAVPAGRRDAAGLLARHLANLNMTLLYTSLSEYIFSLRNIHYWW